jgi:hypothetical protein
MDKSKQTIEESIGKIKFMMNYNSSKTLIENKESVTEQLESPGGIAGKTAAAAGGAALAGGIAGGLGAAGAATAATASAAGLAGAAGSVGLALGAGSITSAGIIGGAALTGGAALLLTPLVLWLIDKDKAYPKTKKLFDYVKTNKDKIYQVERGLDDDTIQTLSDDLYNAMKGLGTRNKMVFRVFNSLVTISDLSTLIATFNEDHENEGKGDLLKWLDSDIDISSTWNKIYVPVRNLVKKFAKKLAAENPPDTTTGTGSSSGGYRPAQGTNEDQYVIGTSGAGIFKVQECLGFTGADLDGKFGPITQGKLMELARQYVNGFTDADIDTICKMAAPRINPQIAGISAISPIPTKDQIIKSPVKVPTLAKPINTTTLAKPTNTLKLAPIGNDVASTTQPPLRGKDKRIANKINRLQNKL